MTNQKYTPPTCTLELTTEKPLFNRLKNQTVSEPFKFKLSFDDPRLPEEEYVTVEGDRTQLDRLSQVVITYVQNFLNSSALLSIVPQDSSNNSKPPHSNPSDIYLKPDGLLYHDLFLGSLSTQNTGPFVHLSALQLFDLVSALEECTNTVSEVRDRRFSIRFKPLIWLRTLLMIFVSIGTLTGMIELINFYRQLSQETLTASQEETETPAIPPPNLTPPALPVWPAPTPPPPASPAPVVPNLPGVDTVPLAVPPPLFPAPVSPPPPQPIPNVSQQEGMMIILPEPQPASPPPQAVNPPVSPPVPVSPPPLPPAPPPTTPPPIVFSPTVPQVPPVIQLPPLQDTTPPEIITVFPEEEMPDYSTVNPEIVDPEVPEDQTSEEGYLAQLEKRPQTIAATRQEDTTLFDQIPQVNEVRTYFQENWYPPKNLRKALQYSLQLNADGTIASITPVGQPAVNRLPQLELPNVGEPFVSATADGRRPKMRVILEPNGRVSVFLESFNNSPPPPVTVNSEQ
ncbi:DUF4335 domain-containing protein [Limnoraphis robusta Tam1]|uniref:DUF4335 domain-containing protein n=1 Tax=Limnoraphis robusta TaxID=1118279 RepID=UPI002B21156B|nr:DUF4335 domain-containing protein [Limnoraphis robusta]MEA5539140.1 DUF4335 domain-containing protein [Limnoraphis robusta Tam1]